jgi:tight adherence protein B
MPVYLVLLVLLSSLCLAATAYYVLADPQGRHQRRLKKRLTRLRDTISYQPEESLLRKSSGPLPRLNQWLEQCRALSSWRSLMLQADIHWQLSSFFALVFLAAGLGWAVGYLRLGPLGGLAGCLLGVALPCKIMGLKAKRRLKRFEQQLPGALELLSRGLKAGHAFAAGLQLVAEEMPAPIGTEFFKTFKEYNHGLDLNSALLNLCQRVNLRDLRFFTTAVMIQRETGGNLAEILEKIANLIRERFKLRNQIQSLTAEGRLSGLILVLLPPATALALYYLNPDYLRLLVTNPLGRMMAITALVFQLLGIVSIRKIVTVKV